MEGSGAGCMMAWLGQGIPPTLVQLRVFQGGGGGSHFPEGLGNMLSFWVP